jgi:hypothetical protein
MGQLDDRAMLQIGCWSFNFFRLASGIVLKNPGKASGRVSPASSWLAGVIGLWPVDIALQRTVIILLFEKGAFKICLYQDIFKNPRVFDEKRLSAERKTGNGRTEWSLLTVVDDLHVQLRIEILSLIKAKFLWLYL